MSASSTSVSPPYPTLHRGLSSAEMPRAWAQTVPYPILRRPSLSVRCPRRNSHPPQGARPRLPPTPRLPSHVTPNGASTSNPTVLLTCQSRGNRSTSRASHVKIVALFGRSPNPTLGRWRTWRRRGRCWSATTMTSTTRARPHRRAQAQRCAPLSVLPFRPFFPSSVSARSFRLLFRSLVYSHRQSGQRGRTQTLSSRSEG